LIGRNKYETLKVVDVTPAVWQVSTKTLPPVFRTYFDRARNHPKRTFTPLHYKEHQHGLA
jgi:hypothetical protein